MYYYAFHQISITSSVYNLNYHSLSTSAQHSYLGILLDNKLSWSSHTKHIITKANKTLNFLKRNLNSCSSSVKASAYLTLVRPSMEYAAAVWDPYHHNDILQLEKVQRRAARWVLNDYNIDTVQSQQCYNNYPGQVLNHVVKYSGYKHCSKSFIMITHY